MIEWFQGTKWRIVIPAGTMHKFLGDNKPYVVNLMCKQFQCVLQLHTDRTPGAR